MERFDLPQKIDLRQKLGLVESPWCPHVVAELNGQQVKVAKLEGEFVWHRHEAEDEFFMVLKGALEIHLRDQVVLLVEGECFVVPRGVEHKPVAPQEVHVLLFEPASTVNTGELRNHRTVTDLKRI